MTLLPNERAKKTRGFELSVVQKYKQKDQSETRKIVRKQHNHHAYNDKISRKRATFKVSSRRLFKVQCSVVYVVMLSEVSHVVLPIGSRPGGSWGNNRDFLAPGPPLGDILPGEYDPGDV